MEITLRLEQPSEYRAVEELIRDAFWESGERTGCDEHYLTHLLRQSPGFVPELDYVAELAGKLAGHVIYSRAKIVAEDGTEYETLTFGPLSVHPEYQNRGIGKALMDHTIAKARQLGFRAILVFGHPDYYPRFGFRRAAEFGVTTPEGKNFDPFMALELYEGALKGVMGHFYLNGDYTIHQEKADAFDRAFPPKEKRAPLSAEVILERLEPRAQQALRSLSPNRIWDIRAKSQREISALPGVDDAAIRLIRETMLEYGYRWGRGNCTGV